MLGEGKDWEAIGSAINWHPPTAERHYAVYAAARWTRARRLLATLAQRAYIGGDLQANAAICELLGIPSAIDHETAADRPK